MSANGLGPLARTAAKIRRCRAITSPKKTTAPQNTGKTRITNNTILIASVFAATAALENPASTRTSPIQLAI